MGCLSDACIVQTESTYRVDIFGLPVGRLRLRAMCIMAHSLLGWKSRRVAESIELWLYRYYLLRSTIKYYYYCLLYDSQLLRGPGQTRNGSRSHQRHLESGSMNFIRHGRLCTRSYRESYCRSVLRSSTVVATYRMLFVASQTLTTVLQLCNDILT